MNLFTAFINVPACCLGFLSCFVVLFAKKHRTLPDYLLLIVLTGFTLATLQDILMSSEYILSIPHLFRAFSPFYYVMIPSIYLFVRVALTGQKKLHKLDFLHFIPAVLHVVELFPWFIHDFAYKQEWIRHSITDPNFVVQLKEGLLPPYYHNIIRSILAGGYLIAIIHKWRHHSSAKIIMCKIMHCNTFWRPGVLFAMLVIIPVYIAIILLFPPNLIGRSNMMGLMIGIIFLVLNVVLFYKPDILYGVISTPDLNLNDKVMAERQFSGMQHHQFYQSELEKVLLTQPYLKPGYSLMDLSNDAGIPRHHLSALINRVYGCRFNDFINRCRIQYISENVIEKDYKNLTIEGIANEAGFNSRTTFFNAIKKFTGLSPKQFLEQSRKE